MIKPAEETSSKFAFDTKLGQSLQEKLLSEPISSQQTNTAFLLGNRRTTDQLLLNDPLKDSFFEEAQLPQLIHQSKIEAFVTALKTMGDSDLKDFSHFRDCNLEDSIYVEVFDKDGKRKVVKKETVVWLLQEKQRKLSSDRALRFRQTTENLNINKLQVVHCVQKQTIQLTNWCLFHTEKGDDKLLGQVMMFSLLNNTKKIRNSTQIWEWKIQEKETEEDAVGVLCIWYEVERRSEILTGALIPSRMETHGFLPCSKYITTVPSPIFNDIDGVSSLMLSTEVVKELSPYFSPLQCRYPQHRKPVKNANPKFLSLIECMHCTVLNNIQ